MEENAIDTQNSNENSNNYGRFNKKLYGGNR